jgi:hypothetical protein
MKVFQFREVIENILQKMRPHVGMYDANSVTTLLIANEYHIISVKFPAFFLFPEHHQSILHIFRPQSQLIRYIFECIVSSHKFRKSWFMKSLRE